MSINDADGGTQYLGPDGWEVLLVTGQQVRYSRAMAEAAENSGMGQIIGPSDYEPPTIPYEPGLPALLYAHGAVQQAEDMHRKLVASGGKVPKGGFPSRCTTTDERGVRCFLGYAHAGEHDFGSGPTVEEAILNTLLTPKRGGIRYGEVRFMPGASSYAPDSRASQLRERMKQLADQQPRTRIISDDTALKFLNEKIENIHEQIQFIDNQLAEHEEKKAAMQRTRAQLRHDENQLHEAIATLTGVRAKKLGEGHGGSR
jgi:hypothetical protein